MASFVVLLPPTLPPTLIDHVSPLALWGRPHESRVIGNLGSGTASHSFISPWLPLGQRIGWWDLSRTFHTGSASASSLHALPFSMFFNNSWHVYHATSGPSDPTIIVADIEGRDSRNYLGSDISKDRR